MFEIKKDIYFTGIKDPKIKSFHRHELSTHRGTSYNSYVLKDEKTVLFDTVWSPHADEFIEALDRDFGLKNIDILVVNHCEPDHGGSLGALMEKIPNVPIYCTKNGADMIRGYNHKDWDFHIVKTGDTLKTGKYELMFIEMQMIHWPDSMMTYIGGADTLISNDAFGQHYACGDAMFNDEADTAELYEEAIKYYANILYPFSALIKRKLEQLALLDLKIDMIAPSHGLIWRKDPMQIVGTYAKWCDNYAENRAIVVFGTIWRSTEKMAKAVAEGMNAEGLDTCVIEAALTDKNDLVTEVFKAKAVAIGSSTISNNVVTSISVLLHEIKALKYKGKPAASFGSYGWSGESGKQISDALKESGFVVAQEPLMVKYNPTREDLGKCVEFGRTFAKGILHGNEVK